MCILQPHSLLLAWGAVAGIAVAPQFAAAQGMARPTLPAGPAAGNMSRPLTNPSAAILGSVGGFRSSPFGMRAYPGMSGASSYGAGSRGSMAGTGGYGGGMSASPYGAQGGPYGAGSYGYGGYSGASAEMSSVGNSIGRVLSAAGVANDGGQLRWPVGLRAVGGPEALDHAPGTWTGPSWAPGRHPPDAGCVEAATPLPPRFPPGSIGGVLASPSWSGRAWPPPKPPAPAAARGRPALARPGRPPCCSPGCCCSAWGCSFPSGPPGGGRRLGHRRRLCRCGPRPGRRGRAAAVARRRRPPAAKVRSSPPHALTARRLPARKWMTQ
jgi:hypothetical protein